MKNFDITLVQRRYVRVKAKNRVAAVRKAMKENIGYQATDVNNERIVGFCELSEEAIFPDDNYTYDEELNPVLLHKQP